MLLGWALPVAIVTLIALLQLEYRPTLLVAAVAFLAAGAFASRRGGRPGAILLALVAPTAAIFALFAINARSWILLGVPAVALAGAVIGASLARRRSRD